VTAISYVFLRNVCIPPALARSLLAIPLNFTARLCHSMLVLLAASSLCLTWAGLGLYTHPHHNTLLSCLHLYILWSHRQGACAGHFAGPRASMSSSRSQPPAMVGSQQGTSAPGWCRQFATCTEPLLMLPCILHSSLSQDWLSARWQCPPTGATPGKYTAFPRKEDTELKGPLCTRLPLGRPNIWQYAGIMPVILPFTAKVRNSYSGSLYGRDSIQDC
jgi:hypothetical protein